MDNIGAEKSTPPNGYRDYREGDLREPAVKTEGTSADTGYRAGVQQSAGNAERSAGYSQKSAGQGEGMRFGQIMNFAKDVQTKVKDIPYIVPIAFGGAGFVLGVLASSRILRQVVLFAGSYALKQAVKNAPTDEMLSIAKKMVIDAIQRQAA